MASSSPYRFREWNPARARTGRRPHDRVHAAFLTPANLAAIRRALAARLPPGPLRDYAVRTAEGEARQFVSGTGEGADLLGHDPLAQRGRQGATGIALGGAAELARLNRAFVSRRLQFVREQAGLLGSADGGHANEPHHMRMFIDDSLRPPGLESLNGKGPLWEHDGDQARSSFEGVAYPDADPGVADCDRAWAPGNGKQTAAETIAEYWGEAAAETMLGGGPGSGTPKICGEAPPTRFERYPTVPRWHRTADALDGVDRDIDEGLGDGNREMGNHVRRWGGHPGAFRERGYRRGDKPFKFSYRAYTH